MIPRHLPLPTPPARRSGSARPCARSVFSVVSATFVLIPALSPKNLSFVFIRLRTLLTIRPRMVILRSATRLLRPGWFSGTTKGRSICSHTKIDPLFSCSCTLFHFPYPVTPLFATLTKTTGVGTNNSQNGTSRLLPERNSHESANCYRRHRLQLRPAPLSASHRQRPSLPLAGRSGHGHLRSGLPPPPQTRR